MKSRQSQPRFLAAMIGSVLVFSTGCQSGMFNKPDLSRLAFWKKDNLQLASQAQEIPPPSSHFAPDTREMDGDTKEQIEAKIAKMAENAKQKSNKNDGLIRKPYSLDAINPRIAENSDSPVTGATGSSNDFELSRKLNQLQSDTDKAMRTAENAVKQTGEQVEDATRSLADLKNQLQAKGEQSKQSINEAAESLQDSAEQFVASTSQTVNQTVSNVKTSVDNTFQPVAASSPVGQVANPYAATSASSMSSRNGQFGSSGQAAASNLTSNAAATGNGFDVPQVPGNVQQSSFDSVTSRPASGLLQPAVAATQPGSGESTNNAPSAYPTTSYGMIRPASRNSSVGSTSTPEIPAHLLQGSSSFSPGSTAQLQPANSAQ